MKTDTIFYDLFQQFPSFFFELLNQPPQAADQYHFSSVEVKQLAFRIDGVFLPNPEATEQPIYFVEVQFQGDEELYARFFSEIFLYLRQTNRINDWRGVLLYPRRSTDIGETTRYQELFDSGRVTRLYLNELAESQSIGLTLFQIIIANERKAINQGRDLIEQIRDQIDDQQQQQKLLQLLETILVYKLP
ncbi:MAG: Rpn family recombination-promoting nuclease/putative transposase, partial [Kamptonema sp. SIO4C4]|nr:Rpn family recombination-promoting nuclease/putative transposase [Kamptonema sp. SIO4C4]